MTEDVDWDLGYDELEIQGPFVPTFITDSKKVWAILHALFSTSGTCQHIKKFTTTQNGRQVYRTLHSHFFGADKINTMYNDILTTLKSMYYSGDRKNFNFDKYFTAHVEQHNPPSTMYLGLKRAQKSTTLKKGSETLASNPHGTPFWSTCDLQARAEIR